MTNPSVEWVLDQLGPVVDDVANNYTDTGGDPVTIKRVDRDNRRVYDGSATIDMSTPIEKRRDDLQRACYIGASYAERSESPAGTEYHLDLETVVGVRIEGFSGDYGQVDPDGQDGVPFSSEDGLVDRVTDAIYDSREFPDAGRSTVTFTHLLLTNHADQSDEFGPYHRYDFDVAFDGFEEL